MKKSILKILVPLIGLTGFFSCQEPENETIDQVSMESSNYEYNIVDGSQIKNVTYALDNILQGKLSSRDNGGPIFDLSNILSLKDSTNNTNYTFNFILPDRPVNERYNLVVGVDSLGNVAEPKVLRFVSTEANLENWIENDFRFSSFQGQIHLHNYTDYFNSFDISGNGTCSDYDENGDPVPCDSEEVDNTGGTGGGGGPGEGTGDGANDGSGSDSSGVTGSGGGCWVSVEWDGCGGSNTNIAHGPGICGGDGTGAGYVVHIDCPGFHETYYKDGDCQDCDSGTSGPTGTNNISTQVQKLNYYLDGFLNEAQLDYLLNTNTELANAINNELLAEMQAIDGDVDRAKLAAFATVEIFSRGLDDDDAIDDAFLASLADYDACYVETGLTTTNPLLGVKYWKYSQQQYAIYDAEHPEWKSWKKLYYSQLDAIHLILDLAGLVPVVGEVFDVANGILYTIEGDKINAGFSFGAAIPGLGWAATGAKFAYKSTTKTASNIASGKVLKWVLGTDGIVYFGRRGLLREVMKSAGLLKKGHHAHHLIPWGEQGHELIQRASKAADPFHMSDLINGKSVEAWRNTTHPAYNNRVRQRMSEITNSNPTISPDEARVALQGLLEDLVDVIDANPNTKLQDLVF
jgi:hypothetical protein